MEDLQIPKATMVGHSMGGRAMMSVALTKVFYTFYKLVLGLAVAHSQIALSCWQIGGCWHISNKCESWSSRYDTVSYCNGADWFRRTP